MLRQRDASSPSPMVLSRPPPIWACRSTIPGSTTLRRASIVLADGVPRSKFGRGSDLDDASVCDGDRRVLQNPPLRVHRDDNPIVNQQVRHRAPLLLGRACTCLLAGVAGDTAAHDQAGASSSTPADRVKSSATTCTCQDAGVICDVVGFEDQRSDAFLRSHI